MRGVLLDPTTGRPEGETTVDRVREVLAARPGSESILSNLRKSRDRGGPFGPRGSIQGWEEVLYFGLADGTQVSATTTETIMVPDFTIPANYLYPGRILKWTILADVSTVITTPGTINFALRWGGVAGTVLANSGAFAPDPTAASTNQSCMVEFWTVCRAVGTAAASYTMGRAIWGDYDDATVTTIVGNLNMTMIPATAPAAVNIDTTTAKAFSPTVKFSVATAGTQFTAHMWLLEALT